MRLMCKNWYLEQYASFSFTCIRRRQPLFIVTIWSQLQISSSFPVLFTVYFKWHSLRSRLSLTCTTFLLMQSLIHFSSLQILSQLDIIIPLDMLLSMFIKVVQNSSEFSEGVVTMFPFPMFTVQSPLTTPSDGPAVGTPVSGVVSADLGELSSNLSCFIMELDLLLKQVTD